VIMKPIHYALAACVLGSAVWVCGAGHGVADASKVALARFEGGVITADDLKASLEGQPPLRIAQRVTPDGRVALLRELVTYELLVLEAKRRGYGRQLAVADARRSAAIEAMLASKLAGQRSEQARKDLIARLRAQHAPQVRAELVDVLELDPLGARDQPQGFRNAPEDPRIAPRSVEPDGF